MRGFFLRGVIVAMVLGVLSPVLASAQSVAEATPAPGPSFDITLLGVSSLTVLEEGTDADGNGLVHALLSITVEPGAPLPPLNGMRSVLVTTQQGSLAVSATGETVRMAVGTGESIQTGDDAQVACERGTCDLEPGQTVVLAPGNGISVTQGTLQMEVRGDTVTVVQMSVILPASVLGGRCWICPQIRP